VARKLYAKRYAQAAFDIALEKKELDKWQTDLRAVAGLGEDSTIVAFLESPKFDFSAKTKLLSERLVDIDPLVLNLVYLLISKGRLSIIGEITDEYQRLVDSYHGIERAEVITAVPLDDQDKINLGERIGSIVGKKVVVEPEVDPRLIGGFIVRIGGKLLDGSTHSRLEALKRELVRR
jgi:F-type H+-transporting ATPase subunit delta